MRIAKIAITATALAAALAIILSTGTDAAALLAAFAELNFRTVILVAAALTAGALLASLRLKLMAADLGYPLSFRDSVAALSLGSVAGAVFFQIAGQIMARGALLSRRNVPVSATVVLTGYERLAATLVSLALAAAGAAYLFGRLTFDVQQGGVALLELVVGVIAAIVAGALLGWGAGVRDHGPRLDAVAMRGVARSIVLSVGIQSLTMLAYVIAGKSLAPHIAVLDLTAAAAIVMLAASLPISLAGWGIREMSAVVALGAVGLSPEAALVVAVLIGAISLASVGLLALGSTSAQPAPQPASRGEAQVFDYTAALQWAVPITTVTLVFFQVHLPVRSGTVNVNLADPIALLGGALFLVLHWRCGAPRWRISHVGAHLTAATCALLVSFAIGVAWIGLTEWQITKVLGWFVLLAYGATGALLAVRAGEEGVKTLMRTFVAVALAVSGLAVAAALAESAGLLSMAPQSLLRQYDSVTFAAKLAIQGFSQNRNAFALLLVLGLCGLGLYPPRWRAPITVGLVAGLFMTGSKAGMVAAAAVLISHAVIGVASKRQIAAAAAAAVVIAAVAALMVPDAAHWAIDWTSQDERLRTLTAGLAMFWEWPIFGAGLGAHFADHALVIHSTPIWLLAELGLVGFAAVLVPLARVAIGSFLERDRVGTFLALVVVTLGVFALVHEVLYQRAFWILMGAALAVPLGTSSGQSAR